MKKITFLMKLLNTEIKLFNCGNSFFNYKKTTKLIFSISI